MYLSDFLPHETDASGLHKRAILYLMEVLATEFSSLRKLKDLVPPRQSPHAVKKSLIAPMKVLFKDEKCKSDTIDILSDIMKHAALTGNPQVCKLSWQYL